MTLKVRLPQRYQTRLMRQMSVTVLTTAILFFSSRLLADKSKDSSNTQLIGAGVIAADATDLRGETVGSIGSGVDYDAENDTYLFTTDRGPGDGNIDYSPRFQAIRLHADDKGILSAEITHTTLYLSPDDKPMTGLIPDDKKADHPALRDGRWCLDSEAIALAPDGTIYVSDEYGPFLYQFSRDGKMLRCIKPPANYLARDAKGLIDFLDNDALVSGRVPNHGFEGMTLSPDGKRAILILQTALVQDGGKHSQWTRILVLDLQSEKAVAEYVYAMENVQALNASLGLHGKDALKQKDLSVTEIKALSDNQFLVLERDNRGPDGSRDASPAKHKCVYSVELDGATNLLEVANTPYNHLPGEAAFLALQPNETVKPVKKGLVFDLLAAPVNRFNLHQDQLADKWEGLAFTPPDAKGKRRLLVACDNDFLTPVIHIGKNDVPFPRAQVSVPTQLLLFTLDLPKKK